MKNYSSSQKAPRVQKPCDLASIDSKDLTEYYVSEKYDGVRGHIFNGELLSASNTPIPNIFCQELFGKNPYLDFADGELLTFPSSDPRLTYSPFRLTSGIIRSKLKSGKESGVRLAFFVLDHTNRTGNYNPAAVAQKVEKAREWMAKKCEEKFNTIEVPYLIAAAQYNFDPTHFGELLHDAHTGKIEGVMLRHKKMPYFHGRSSATNPGLIRSVFRETREYEVVGFQPRKKNVSISFQDERGLLKKSRKQQDLVEVPQLGALVCKTPKGEIFSVGTGFSEQERTDMFMEILKNPEAFNGKQAKISSKAFNETQVPREPVFEGFRESFDSTNY